MNQSKLINIKKITSIVVMLFISTLLNAQNQENIPDSFLKHINAQVGVWIADNAEYQNEQEPYEAYGLEWKYGLGKKSLTGRLYGIKDGIDIGTFWEFRNYWDADKKTAILMQFGSDGAIGVGPLSNIETNETELLQIFTATDGSQYKSGHRTQIIDSTKHIGSSYSIDEQNKWNKNRTYTWERQTLKKEEVSNQASLKGLDFIVGKWKAIAKDSAFISVLEYKFSPENKLLMATNHLYGKDGKLFAQYEGAYLLEVDKIFYILAGPGGEIHKGYATADKNKVTHYAHLFPGKGVKSYKSEMHLKNGKLFYYANYSKETEIPKEIDYSSPLIYTKMKD